MRMFTSVANCARTPPMLFPVEPFPCCVSRSITSTLRQPASVRCQAMLEPTMPPPMITTSADSLIATEVLYKRFVVSNCHRRQVPILLSFRLARYLQFTPGYIHHD